jgi:hypothetical protein
MLSANIVDFGLMIAIQYVAPEVIDTGTVLVTKEKLATDPEVRRLVGM